MNRLEIPLWLRYATIVVGIAVLVWLPFEDASTFWIILLSALVSLILILRAGFRWRHWVLSSPWRVLILAAMGGLAVAPISIVMIILKSGVHIHDAADFTGEQIISLLLRAPFWMLGSVLIGLGIVLWRSFRSDWESKK